MVIYTAFKDQPHYLVLHRQRELEGRRQAFRRVQVGVVHVDADRDRERR